MTSKVSAPRTRLPASERRAEIVAAARRIALVHGLIAVTLRAVATDAGVAPGLVAHYVPSMDELVASTFSDIVGDELGELERLLAEQTSPLDALRALLDTLLDGTREDVTLVWVQGWGLGSRNDALAEAVRQAMDAWDDFLEQIVRAGVAAGDFVTDDPRGLARQVIGMIDGLNAHALVRRSDAQQHRALTAVAVEAMLGMPRGALSMPFATSVAGAAGASTPRDVHESARTGDADLG